MPATANVLVVDDEPVVGRSCSRALSEDGYRVNVALNGAEALNMIQSDSYDVALLDLRMPGSGGLDVLRKIRKVSPGTEVVVITGYPSIDNAKESIRLGAFAFLTKPFVPQTLRTVVCQALASKPWKLQGR
jgi:two-component system NtrC family response regulator